MGFRKLHKNIGLDVFQDISGTAPKRSELGGVIHLVIQLDTKTHVFSDWLDMLQIRQNISCFGAMTKFDWWEKWLTYGYKHFQTSGNDFFGVSEALPLHQGRCLLWEDCGSCLGIGVSSGPRAGNRWKFWGSFSRIPPRGKNRGWNCKTSPKPVGVVDFLC